MTELQSINKKNIFAYKKSQIQQPLIHTLLV
jgi:hypothetical protein